MNADAMDSDRELVGQFIDASVDDPELARRLVESHPQLRNARWIHDETALHFLAVEGFADAVRLLIDLGFDVNATNEFGDPPLIDVAALGNDEIIEALLAAGADPNYTSKTHDTVLHCAVRSGNARLVRLLLSAGANSDYVTDIGETVYDALPQDPDERDEIERILRAQ